MAPLSRCSASPRALSVLARTISFTASARVRSILPLRNARWVNSPGPAGAEARAGEKGKEPLDHRDAPVAEDLRRVLACIASRRPVDREEHLVDVLAAIAQNAAMDGVALHARHVAAAREAGQDPEGALARDADHGQRAGGGGRGKGGNGVLGRVNHDAQG